MTTHAARGHATWSASATERNWACPGALALTDGLPDRPSEAADWGTCAHQIAEKCLRGKGPAERYVGTTEKGKKFSFEVDEEMAETAQIYVDHVVSLIDADPDSRAWIEHRLSLASLNPPFDAGGTADAVVYSPRERLLDVVDLKGGRGVVVEVEGNPQGRSYALGAVLTLPGLDVERIRVTIVQPRAPHRDGRIRSEIFHVADLIEWAADLLTAMKRSAEAVEARTTAPPATWADAYLNPGDHCKFCRALSFCPAVEQKAMDEIGVWFTEIDEPRIANEPDAMDPAALARKLDLMDMIEDWVKAVRAEAHSQAEGGIEIPGYVLVAKHGREKWKDGTEDKVRAAAREAGLLEAKYLNPAKLRTPKQVRQALGARADLVAGLSETPQTGTNLVRATKTSRPAVAPAVHQHFSVID